MHRRPAQRFEDLIVWQQAHQLVLSVYRFSDGFPRKEMYGICSQIRRSAVSVAANITEGFKRKTKLEKVRFLNISQGSLEESRYYLILARDLGYGETEKLFMQIEEVSKLLYAYSTAILSSVS